MRIPQISLLAFGALALAACGGNDQPAAPAEAPAAPSAPVEAPAPTTPATPTSSSYAAPFSVTHSSMPREPVYCSWSRCSSAVRPAGLTSQPMFVVGTSRGCTCTPSAAG